MCLVDNIYDFCSKENKFFWSVESELRNSDLAYVSPSSETKKPYLFYSILIVLLENKLGSLVP